MKVSPAIFVVGVLLVLFAGCTSYDPPRPVEPVYEDKVYEQGYTGEVTGTIHYRVMIVDDIDTQFVCDSLQYVPGWYEFEIVAPDSTKYMIETKGNLIGAHIPLEDNLIVVFDAEEHNVSTFGGVSYFGGSANWKNRLSIAVFDYDTRLNIGARVYHEALHATEQGGEADGMEINNDYRNFHGSTVLDQERYYTYLLCKYRGDVI